MDEESGNDIAADLAAAWDAAEEDMDAEGSSEVLESSADESDAPGGGADEHDPEVQPEGEPSGVRGGEEQDASAQAPDNASLDTPPQALSPEAREAWKDTPEAIRKEIAKREKDYAYGIEKHRANTERVRAMDQTLAPYQQFFALNGGPSQVLPGLLQAGATLQMGTDTQKVQTVANLIKQFGVNISKLDEALVDGTVKPDKNEEIEQMLNQRLQPLQQQLQQYQQREQQAAQQRQQELQTDIQKFAQGAEFFSDVRTEMADLMEMAANRGRPMTLKEAYDIACSTHPSISKIISNREAQKQVASKRQAASSVHGSPGASSLASDHDSRRSAIIDAWDNFGRM